jgi:integrase
MGQGARPPVTRKLPFLKSYRDRHGKERHYFRKPGAPSVAIPGEHGSKEFMEAYWRLREDAPKREIGKERVEPGSISALIALYYSSTAFKRIKPQTRQNYRNVLERFREERGALPVRTLKPRHVAAMLDALADKPGAQYSLRRVLRLILSLAVERDWIKTHPMADMRRPRKTGEGFRAWTDADIAAFEAKWPSGSRERLAMALLLYTGQRRSDVVTMGRQHVRDGKIRVVQQKTGTELWISLHSRLKAEIAAAPKDHLNLLTTAYGKPFTANGFGNWFREACKEAGLPERTNSHGLRKAAARRLAEAGCTPHQIMAVTGHKNLSEVTLYTASADQERLAGEAVRMIEGGTEVSNPGDQVRHEAGNA